MEMSIREFKAKVSAAVAAVQRGEAVTITKFGKPVADLVPVRPKRETLDFAAADAYLKSIDWNPRAIDLWPSEFDDPAYSRQVLGLDD